MGGNAESRASDHRYQCSLSVLVWFFLHVLEVNCVLPKAKSTAMVEYSPPCSYRHPQCYLLQLRFGCPRPSAPQNTHVAISSYATFRVFFFFQLLGSQNFSSNIVCHQLLSYDPIPIFVSFFPVNPRLAKEMVSTSLFRPR